MSTTKNKEIVNRCRIATKAETLQDFAKTIGVSKQIVTASCKLKKPPLTIIEKTAELTGYSYDWLINGKNTSGSVQHLTEPNVMSPIGMDHEWIEKVLGLDINNLRFLESGGGNTIWIINLTSQFTVSGKYVFNLNGAMSVYGCKMRIDDSLVIDGEEYPKDRIPTLVGKVVCTLSVE